MVCFINIWKCINIGPGSLLKPQLTLSVKTEFLNSENLISSTPVNTSNNKSKQSQVENSDTTNELIYQKLNAQNFNIENESEPQINTTSLNQENNEK